MGSPSFRRVPDHHRCTVCDRTFPLKVRADIITGKLPCGHDVGQVATVTRVEQRCHIIEIDTWLDQRRHVVEAGGGAPWSGWTRDADRYAGELLVKRGNYGGRHRFSFGVVSADPLVPLFKQPELSLSEQA